ncbi:unnamed protein product, partial [Cladocopium goreaui]
RGHIITSSLHVAWLQWQRSLDLMAKVKKSHLKSKKAKAKAKQADKNRADGDGMVDVPKESRHELKRRHAAERKALQAKIVELKRQRKKLPKKKNKDDKKALSEEIKSLTSALKKRHADELQHSGLNVQEGEDESGSEDFEEDDEDI